MSRDCPVRNDYLWFCDMPTRWMDNDVYGHVNNVTYYSYFDTVANRYLIEAGGLDIHNAPVVPRLPCPQRLPLVLRHADPLDG